MQPAQPQVKSPSQFAAGAAYAGAGMAYGADSAYKGIKGGLGKVTGAPGWAMDKATKSIQKSGWDTANQSLAKDMKALTRYATKVHEYGQNSAQRDGYKAGAKCAVNVSVGLALALATAGISAVVLPAVLSTLTGLLISTEQPSYDHERAYVSSGTACINAAGTAVSATGSALAGHYSSETIVEATNMIIGWITFSYGALSDLDASMNLNTIGAKLIKKMQEEKNKKMAEHFKKIASERKRIQDLQDDAAANNSQAQQDADEKEEFWFFGSKVRFLPKMSADGSARKRTIAELAEKMDGVIKNLCDQFGNSNVMGVKNANTNETKYNYDYKDTRLRSTSLFEGVCIKGEEMAHVFEKFRFWGSQNIIGHKGNLARKCETRKAAEHLKEMNTLHNEAMAAHIHAGTSAAKAAAAAAETAYHAADTASNAADTAYNDAKAAHDTVKAQPKPSTPAEQRALNKSLNDALKKTTAANIAMEKAHRALETAEKEKAQADYKADVTAHALLEETAKINHDAAKGRVTNSNEANAKAKEEISERLKSLDAHSRRVQTKN